MDNQDYKTIVFSKKKKGGGGGGGRRSPAASPGESVQRNAYAGGNRQKGGTGRSAAKVEEEELGHIPTVSQELKVRIQQARQAKGWTQKELAQKINEKPTVVADYEAGRAIPNPQILSKLSRKLGVNLRSKKK